MSRGRVIVVLAVIVVILVPVCVLIRWDPFNLRYQGFLAAASAGLVAVAAATAAVLAWRRRAIRITAVALGSVGVLFAAGTAWLSAEFSPRPDGDRVASPDGRYELVSVRGVLGPEVRLRRDRGLLSQETVVWYDDGSSPNGLDSGTVVPTFRFVDAHSVEVSADGCNHRSTFNTRTLLLTDRARPFRTSNC